MQQKLLVTRKWPELIAPVTPTPTEPKQLSDIDDQECLRIHVPLLFFYNYNPSMKHKDPVVVIKEGLSKALVFYYPLAGRLTEGPDRKLSVDCNGEGVLFIEADGDFTLKELGDGIVPPCPYLDEFLYNVPGSDAILGSPLILIQVTRLKCGGFVVGVRLNHTMCDAAGLFQFLNTIKEMTNGLNKPSKPPVWSRHLLKARVPPKLTCAHNEFDTSDAPMTEMEDDPTIQMDHKSIFFGPKQINALKSQLPPHLINNCSTFDLIVSCIWRCRALALDFDPEEMVRISIVTSIRGRRFNNYLPEGYYGNAFAYPGACSRAEVLRKKPLGYAVELVKQAKGQMSVEYLQSVMDFNVMSGRKNRFIIRGACVVSDNVRSGFSDLDLGWGEPLMGGPASAISSISFVMRYRDGFVVPMCLPATAMNRFQSAMHSMTSEKSSCLSSKL